MGEIVAVRTFLPAASDFRDLPLLLGFSGGSSAAAASSAAGAGRTTPPPPPDLPDPNESLDCTHLFGRFALDDEGESGGLAGDGDGVGVGGGGSSGSADPAIGMGEAGRDRAASRS